MMMFFMCHCSAVIVLKVPSSCVICASLPFILKNGLSPHILTHISWPDIVLWWVTNAQEQILRTGPPEKSCIKGCAGGLLNYFMECSLECVHKTSVITRPKHGGRRGQSEHMVTQRSCVIHLHLGLISELEALMAENGGTKLSLSASHYLIRDVWWNTSAPHFGQRASENVILVRQLSRKRGTFNCMQSQRAPEFSPHPSNPQPLKAWKCLHTGKWRAEMAKIGEKISKRD